MDHPIVDIALGLIFFWVVLSLVASSVQEWIASLLGLRSKNLAAGIKNLLSDEYAKKVYSHPLINKLSQDNKLPSYINSKTLSTVLLDVLAKDTDGKSFAGRKADEVKEVIGKIDKNSPIRGILETLVNNGEDAAEDLNEKLTEWFDEGMTRVSGWYKRRVKVIIIIIATVVTIGTNASTIHIAEALWQNDALRTSIATQATNAATTGNVTEIQNENLTNLEKFPIGWEHMPSSFFQWLKAILGWLITIAAVSLGAPFWFDLLGKVANLKGSGGKAPSNNSKAK